MQMTIWLPSWFAPSVEIEIVVYENGMRSVGRHLWVMYHATDRVESGMREYTYFNYVEGSP